MAGQQAWDDFNTLKGQLDYFEGQISNCLKGELAKVEGEVATILGDAPRAAACVALADQHPKWTSATMVGYYNKLMALKAYLIAQGF